MIIFYDTVSIWGGHSMSLAISVESRIPAAQVNSLVPIQNALKSGSTWGDPFRLTHCGLAMPYSITDHTGYWFRQNWHQAITWTIFFFFSSVMKAYRQFFLFNYFIFFISDESISYFFLFNFLYFFHQWWKHIKFFYSTIFIFSSVMKAYHEFFIQLFSFLPSAMKTYQFFIQSF